MVSGAVTRPSRESETSSEAESLELILPSGRTPLGFVRDSRAIYLVGRERSARWPVDLLRGGVARLSVEDHTVVGTAELIVDPSVRSEVLDRFRAKYGPLRYERWYRNPARVLRVRLASSPEEFDAAGHYYDWLAAEFDNVADDYDRHILGNRINRLLRDRSLAELRRVFASSHALLEIGCGSGMETIPLLRDGHEILCVDISARMLDVVREKARREGLAERVRTELLTAGSVGRLLEQVGPAAFDGAYSTYGALNCEESLLPIPPALHRLLRPGAQFVAGVYNRWCAFEVVGYALTGQFVRAFGRTGRPVRVGSSRFCVDIFSYSPSTFAGIFASWFTRETTLGVPALLPPSDLVAYAEKFSRHFDRLDRWDRAAAGRWPFRLLGDHFLMVMRRRDSVPASAAPTAANEVAVVSRRRPFGEVPPFGRAVPSGPGQETLEAT